MLKTLGYIVCLIGVYSLLYVVDVQSFLTCLSIIGVGVFLIKRRKKTYHYSNHP